MYLGELNPGQKSRMVGQGQYYNTTKLEHNSIKYAAVCVCVFVRACVCVCVWVWVCMCLLLNLFLLFKWAKVELNCLIRLGDISFRSYLVLMEKAKNIIDFEGLLLLNELGNWAQLGLILKSCVSSLKWAQVEVNLLIHLEATVLQSWCYFRPLPSEQGNF